MTWSKLPYSLFQVHVIQTKDGSGKGAALIAAIVSRLKKNALSLERGKTMLKAASTTEDDKKPGKKDKKPSNFTAKRHDIFSPGDDNLRFLVDPGNIKLQKPEKEIPAVTVQDGEDDAVEAYDLAALVDNSPPPEVTKLMHQKEYSVEENDASKPAETMPSS